MAKIIGVKFKENGKTYYFAHDGQTHAEGSGVIVETSRGAEYAKVCISCKEVPDEELAAPLKPILRSATEEDENIIKNNAERRIPALKAAEEKIRKHNLDMKLVDCEFAFDGSKVIFYFTSEGRVDFRELVKDLSSVFRTRIELRQIGIRDEAKMLGGFGPCGRECCCSSCMRDFKKVSIKMAKNQGLSLNPGKISGLCGRLMCCLAYENDYYAEACKKMPKVGGEVGTPEGAGTVIGNNMLKMEVKVRIDKADGSVYKDFPVESLNFRRKCKEESSKESDEAEDEELKNLTD